jgi:FkbM family methyltransferase
MAELVFDIGLHNGDDAAYYLSLGYRVVGVEADPLLAAKCKVRFQNEIQQGRMTVVNAGVLKDQGEFTFYRNLTDDGWSSFVPEKAKAGGKWEELRIPCVTTQQLIQEHGSPFFVKIDIRGADFQALESITPAAAPPYISLGMNCADPFLERLIDLGYDSFKFSDGETYRTTPPIFDHQVGWRFVRKIGRAVPLIRQAIRKLPQPLRPYAEYDPPGRHNPAGYPFTKYSSGPFGEQAAGAWLDRSAARRWLDRLKSNHRRAGEEHLFWWDVHARHTCRKHKSPLI